MTAATRPSLADLISEELLNISVDHSIRVMSQRTATYPGGYVSRSVQGVAKFGSVRAFAGALERAGADASYSAGSGWTFREVKP